MKPGNFELLKALPPPHCSRAVYTGDREEHFTIEGVYLRSRRFTDKHYDSRLTLRAGTLW